jgi:hypothetical protein
MDLTQDLVAAVESSRAAQVNTSRLEAADRGVSQRNESAGADPTVALESPGGIAGTPTA